VLSITTQRCSWLLELAPLLVVKLHAGYNGLGGAAVDISNHAAQGQHLLLHRVLNFFFQFQHLALVLRQLRGGRLSAVLPAAGCKQ
jgi:hypothetical protein